MKELREEYENGLLDDYGIDEENFENELRKQLDQEEEEFFAGD